jgi:dTDP-4-amino-4,6-dideoxygalactose transaminase
MEKKSIQVTRSSLPALEEYIEEIKDIWDSHWMTNMGAKHMALEKKLAAYLGAPQISLFANGHLALECAIEALELKGEVITTPFTFASTTHALVRKGLTPVFCDIDPEDYTIDTGKLENLVTENTSAILPVHVYGNICDYDTIKKIAQKYDLKVLYDAAHAFGVTVGGKGVAALGDASMFSFHATKVFHTIEGGAVTFREPQMYTRLYALKNFGIAGPEAVLYVGGNAKMNEFQAAMGLCNLRHIEDEIQQRKIVVERYRERLSGIPGLKLNPIQDGVKSNYAYFPVIFDEARFGKTRDQIQMQLQQHNIFTRKYFYPLTNTYECYRNRFNAEDTSIAVYIADRVLTLPLYVDLALKDVDRICDIILDV